MIEIGDFAILEEWSGADYGDTSCYVPSTLIDELSRAAPAWVQTRPEGYRGLFVKADSQTPEYQAVWRILQQHGYQPAYYGRSGTTLPRNQFMFRLDRKFSEQDLLDAPYLNISLDTLFAETTKRCPAGMYVPRPRKVKLGYATYGQYFVCNDAVKAAIEAQRIHVELKPILRSESPEDVLQGYYELTTSVTMPPLKELTITNAAMDKYDGNPDKTWRLYDGFYKDPQLHFEKTAFEQISAFDLAYTQEPLSCKMSVCSNRLFQLFRKYDKNLKATPIRLS